MPRIVPPTPGRHRAAADESLRRAPVPEQGDGDVPGHGLRGGAVKVDSSAG